MRHVVRFSMSLAILILSSHFVTASYIYQLTQSQSEIDLQVSGTALGGGLTVSEQNPNARTRYSGNVETNFHAGFGANSRISFPGGGSANAINPTGLFNLPFQYSPGINGGSGTAPANYGVNLTAPVDIVLPPITIPDFGTIDFGTISQVNFRVALRETQLSVSSTSQIPIDPVTREFDASLLSINVNQSFGDLNGSLRFSQSSFGNWLAVGAALVALQTALPDLGITTSASLLTLSYDVGFGTRIDLSGVSLANSPTASGIVTYNDITEASNLTIPINADFADIDFGLGTLSLKLSGQLRGNATIPNIYHVPEPSALLLVGIVSLGGLTHRRRSRLSA